MTGIDICISFDTTGSMYPALLSVRRNVKNLVDFLYKNNPETRVSIIAQGCYSDRESSYVLDTLDFLGKEKKNDVINFIQEVNKTNGYDWAEAYELLFHTVHNNLSWRNDNKLFIFIADAEPHNVGYCSSCRYNVVHDWRKELETLKEKDIDTFAIRALTELSSTFYNTIGDVFSHQTIPLTQFDDLYPIIRLLHSQVNGNFDEEVVNMEASEQINLGVARAIDAILGKKADATTYEKKVATRYSIDLDATDLEIVRDGRFQIIHVDEDCPIKTFVENTGATFAIGRGFYQLNKSETVQEKKEIVLEHKGSGVLYTGAKARLMMGLPFGERGRLSPRSIPEGYNAFIQSTSWNRKLISGTRFLYEHKYSK